MNIGFLLVKGIVSRDEHFLILIIIISRYLLSVHALIALTIFLSSWKYQIQSFSLPLWYCLLILKILRVTRLKDPKAATLKLKMLTGSRLWKVNSCAFSLQAMRGRHKRTSTHRSTAEKGILRRVSVSIFKVISMKQMKSLLFYKEVKSCWKDFENHQRRYYW